MDAVSNTPPLCYLVLLESVEFLHGLFGNFFVPPSVLAELADSDSPEMVRRWAAAPPKWIQTRQPSSIISGLKLHTGELHAISLALELNPHRLLIDDRAGRAAANALGIPIAGTLAILDLAAEHKLLSLPDAIARLRKTNFRISERLLQEVLRRDATPRSK